MGDGAQQQEAKLETVEPLGKRVLIRKDEDKKVTKGGIELPDSVEIPTITGRIVAVSAQIDHDDDFPIRQSLIHPLTMRVIVEPSLLDGKSYTLDRHPTKLLPHWPGCCWL